MKTVCTLMLILLGLTIFNLLLLKLSVHQSDADKKRNKEKKDAKRNAVEEFKNKLLNK